MAATFAKQHEALESLLRDAQAEKLELPTLVPPRTSLQRWWDALTDKFWSWLEELFEPALRGMRIDPELFGALFKYAIVIILVLTVGYLIYRLISDREMRERAMRLLGGPPHDSASTPPDLLESALSAALRAQNYPLAARLRWSIFLKGNRLQDGLTPLDFSKLYPAAASVLPAHYPLMFRPESGREPEYRNLDETLTSLSRQVRG